MAQQSTVQPAQATKVAEIVRCGREPLYFMRTYAKVRTPTAGVVPFKTWAFQDNCVEDFHKHRLNILLKSRQLGLSTLCAVYALWMALFQKDKSILVIATKLATAQNFIKKVKVALENLPPWLLLTKLTTESKSQLAFSNGSEITAITTSDDAGRSEALSLLIVDEAAFISNFEEIWTGLYPTISGGGRAILISTPNGVGGQYYKLWVEAVSGLNDFNPIKLLWDVRPDRNQQWFEKETKNLSRRKVGQEYLCDFLTSGDTFLQADDLEWLRTTIAPPIDKIGFDRNLWVWANPVPGRRYILSSDVARGVGATGDYSTCHVIDPTAGEVVAEYRSRIPPDGLAKVLAETGAMYNMALIAPENNTFGMAACTYLRDVHKYPHIFYDVARSDMWTYVPRSHDEVPGFSTQAGSRQQILTKLEELIRTRSLKIKSERFYEEMHAFVWSGAKAQASKDSHDDLIMSLAIGAWLADIAGGNHGDRGASAAALLSALTVNRRDVSSMPTSHIRPLINPKLMVSPQSSVYKGLTSRPRKGSVCDFSWLMG